MRVGRFEALPDSALGTDLWQITEDDAVAANGKRHVRSAPNKIRAEMDLMRLSTRAVHGAECLGWFIDGAT